MSGEEAGRALFEETTGRVQADQWPSLDETSKRSWVQRAAGNLDFIPSKSSLLRREAPQAVSTRIPEPEVARVLVELDDERVPGGARTIARKAVKHGWKVLVSYARGPERVQSAQEAEEGDLIRYAQADSILVRGHRLSSTGQRQSFAASWIRKPWTKAGQSPPTKQGAGGYQGDIRQIRPRPADADNGKVDSKQLTAFIESEETTS